MLEFELGLRGARAIQIYRRLGGETTTLTQIDPKMLEYIILLEN